MDLSVVVPVHNEADNIAPLVAEIRAALDGRLAYEIVYVDDCSIDGTVAALRAAREAGAPVRVIRHRARCGQSAAIRSGVKAARAPWIATLDGDGQNDPADIPNLWAMRARHGDGVPALMIAGERRKRRDPWSKRQASRWANAIRGRLLKDRTPDTGCGLKLFPRALFLELPFFDHMHRFLGALMIRQGAAILSVPVNHRPRLKGSSKYGFWDRLWVGISDMVGVMWLQRRANIPHSDED
jgi:dolichol-phosphate mannosyltransferase